MYEWINENNNENSIVIFCSVTRTISQQNESIILIKIAIDHSKSICLQSKRNPLFQNN